jgi:acetyl esterase/lipase
MAEAAWRRRFRAPRVSLPSWARDDPERLLYSSNAGGKWELYVWDRRAGTHRQVTNRPEGTMAGRLDPTGRHVWWLDDERGNEFGRWAVAPFEDGGPRPAAPDLPPAYAAGLAVGRSCAVMGASTREGTQIYLLPAAPGPPRLLYAHRESAWVRGLSKDETLIAIGHSEHGDSRHPALRILDRDGRTVRELWDGPGRSLMLTAWSPVAGDSRALVEHERGDMPAPLIWDPATGAVTEIDAGLPGEVDAVWYPDASSLLLVHVYRGRSEMYRFDLASREARRLEVEPGTIAEARVRPDGQIWYAWSRSSDPPQIRADGATLLRPPGEPAPGGPAYSDHVVEGIHIFLAEPAAPRPHPTVFQIHGGPSSHDRDAFSPRVQAWVDHGYAVVMVNYRGSTGYGRAWRDALEGNPGFTELEDIAKVRDWVVASAIADPRRIILAGRSWGGYLTLLGLGVQPERWSLGIAGVPVADYIAAYEDEMEPLKAFDRAIFKGTPEEIPEVYRERSPITYAARVRVPVLILAGENDPRCPIRQIDRYIARLRDLGAPHDVYRYDAGHGSLVVDEMIRQAEREMAFAARHLGTPPPL